MCLCQSGFFTKTGGSRRDFYSDFNLTSYQKGQELRENFMFSMFK